MSSGKSLVSLRPCNDYRREDIKKNLEAVLSPLGGSSAICKSGESVLLKPNMLSPALPEAAVTTHPEIVRAVAEMVMDCGGKPFIADSPPTTGFEKIAEASGIGAVAEALGIPLHPLEEPMEKQCGTEKLFTMLELSRQALEADRIINLPKLKTHAMMLMTMSVKNMFGCVVGLKKAQWHLMAGENKLFFAKLMVSIYEAMSPALTIMDGVTGLEGDGPGRSGTPVDIGLLAASADGVALDRVMLDIVGVNSESLYTNVAAREMGVGNCEPERIEVVGTPVADIRKVKIRLPKGVGMVPLPKWGRRMANRYLVPRPREEAASCTLCGECADICPVEVIEVGKEKLAIDYDRCIRCYCCVEICPEGSMKPYEPALSKLLGII